MDFGPLLWRIGRKGQSRRNWGKDGGLIRGIIRIVTMDRSVYQARWLLAPVFALGLSAALLVAVLG